MLLANLKNCIQNLRYINFPYFFPVTSFFVVDSLIFLIMGLFLIYSRESREEYPQERSLPQANICTYSGRFRDIFRTLSHLRWSVLQK